MERKPSRGPRSATVKTAERGSHISDPSLGIRTWASTGSTTSHKHTSFTRCKQANQRTLQSLSILIYGCIVSIVTVITLRVPLFVRVLNFWWYADFTAMCDSVITKKTKQNKWLFVFQASLSYLYLTETNITICRVEPVSCEVPMKRKQ